MGAGDAIQRFYRRAFRLKPVEHLTSDTKLRKCLGIVDLIFLGIGAMVDSGIYVLTGIAAKDDAGPSILISFVIASVLAAMVAACFTELASRIHKTGSTYQYVYVTMGELPAFLLGMCVLIIITLSTAVNGRAGVAYIDAVFNGAIVNFTYTHIGHWTVGSPIAPYPDFLAAALILIVAVVVALGVQCTTKVNAVLASLNILVLLFITIAGYVYADLDNWTSPEVGGFFPFGFGGVIAGSASCFWAVTGFEQLAVAVEEVSNPRRSIPIAMTVCLTVVLLLYLGASSALTLMVPYNLIDRAAPFPRAFQLRGVPWAQYICAVGPTFGLLTALINSLYGFGRFVYTISEDGLLMASCGKVNPRTRVPSASVLVGGALMAVIAVFFDVEGLLDFSVNIYLIQYTVIGIVVIYLRYKPGEIASRIATSETDYRSEVDASDDSTNRCIIHNQTVAETHHSSDEAEALLGGKQSHLYNEESVSDRSVSPLQAGTLKSELGCCNAVCAIPQGMWIKIALFTICVLSILLTVAIVNGKDQLVAGEWEMVLVVSVIVLLMVMLTASLYLFNQNATNMGVQMPCVPLLPMLTIVFCLTLLVINSSLKNWIITIIMFSAGLIFYCLYGAGHSILNKS